MFPSFAASGSPNTDFLHVDLSCLVNSEGCNKTRDTWEVNVTYSSGFFLDYFSYLYVSFQVQTQYLHSQYQMASWLP